MLNTYVSIVFASFVQREEKGVFCCCCAGLKNKQKRRLKQRVKEGKTGSFFFLKFPPPHKVVHQSEVREFLLFASCNHLPVQFPLPFRQLCLTSADTAAYNVRGKIAKITFGKGPSVACLVKRRGWGANLHPLVQLLTCYWGCRTFFSFCCDSAVWPCCYW